MRASGKNLVDAPDGGRYYSAFQMMGMPRACGGGARNKERRAWDRLGAT